MEGASLGSCAAGGARLQAGGQGRRRACLDIISQAFGRQDPFLLDVCLAGSAADRGRLGLPAALAAQNNWARGGIRSVHLPPALGMGWPVVGKGPPPLPSLP